MSKLVIVLPVGRTAAGRAVLLGDGGEVRLGPFPVLGTASNVAAARHGNAARDWRKPFGDTPTGSYVLAGALAPDGARRRRKLPGALVLAPTAGNALRALAEGRTRFLLHGGTLGTDERLRATHGGLRVTDDDLTALVRALNESNARGDALTSVEVVELSPLPWHAPPKKRRPTRRDFVSVALASLAVLACGGDDTFVEPGDGGEGGGDGGGTDGGYQARWGRRDRLDPRAGIRRRQR